MKQKKQQPESDPNAEQIVDRSMPVSKFIELFAIHEKGYDERASYFTD